MCFEDASSFNTKGLKGLGRQLWGTKSLQIISKQHNRTVLTFEEKKRSITHLFKTFSGLRLGCNAFILAKGQKIRSTERFKTSAILNVRFRENHFKLKVNSRAVMSQTDKQPNVEVRSV